MGKEKSQYPCPEGFPPDKWALKTEGEKASWYKSAGYTPPAPKADKKTKGGEK